MVSRGEGLRRIRRRLGLEPLARLRRIRGRRDTIRGRRRLRPSARRQSAAGQSAGPHPRVRKGLDSAGRPIRDTIESQPGPHRRRRHPPGAAAIRTAASLARGEPLAIRRIISPTCHWPEFLGIRRRKVIIDDSGPAMGYHSIPEVP